MQGAGDGSAMQRRDSPAPKTSSARSSTSLGSVLGVLSDSHKQGSCALRIKIQSVDGSRNFYP